MIMKYKYWYCLFAVIIIILAGEMALHDHFDAKCLVST